MNRQFLEHKKLNSTMVVNGRRQSTKDQTAGSKSKAQMAKKRGASQQGRKGSSKDDSEIPPEGLDPKTMKLQAAELENIKLRKQLQQMQQSQGKSTESQSNCSSGNQSKNTRIPSKVARAQSKISDSDDDDDEDTSTLTSSFDQDESQDAQVTYHSKLSCKRKKRKFDEKSLFVPVKGDMMEHVEKEVKKQLRKIKFLRNKEETRQLCELIMKDSNLLVKYTMNNRTYDECLSKFVEDYGPLVLKTVNQYRTNAQSDVKKAYVDKYLSLEDGKSMPTWEEFHNIVMRNIGRPDVPPEDYMPYYPSEELNERVQAAQTIIDGLLKPDQAAKETADEVDEEDDDATVSEKEPKKPAKGPKKLDKDQKKILKGAQKDLQAARDDIDEERNNHLEMRQKRWETEGIHDQSIPVVSEYHRKLQWVIWYWECILPAIAKKDGWGHSVRCYGTISKHGPPDDPEAKYITAADEALCLLFYQNGEKRFPYVAECTKKRQTVDQKSANYVAKWSSSKTGQSRYGGWSKEGVEHFLLYRKKMAKVRRMESTHRVEEDALNIIQAKRRIRNGPVAADPMADPQEEEPLDDNLGGFMDDSDDEAVEDDGFDPYVLPPAKKAKRDG